MVEARRNIRRLHLCIAGPAWFHVERYPNSNRHILRNGLDCLAGPDVFHVERSPNISLPELDSLVSLRRLHILRNRLDCLPMSKLFQPIGSSNLNQLML
ncbi:hypothetical protein GCK32_019516 [Trichostrongylus colubriformis]|uniref:Uncharacterized protein n=1 Tax=Trichostrongylus colubriformis TaxID=6319 RepID=A0AAN8IVC4_TRICO